MNPLRTLARRTTALRQVAELLSAQVMCGVWRQAPYLMSGGVVSFAAAIAVSRLLPTTAAEKLVGRLHMRAPINP